MRTHFPIAAPVAGLVLAAALSSPVLAQTFTRVTDPANPIPHDLYQSGGGCWVDLVGDGFLDLFVANGNLTNQPNRLYRNDRAGGFVSVVTGPVVNDGGSSIGGTFGDFDNDGHLDLFVTNRNNFGNFLYRGLGDTLFAKVSSGGPATDIANSNSSSWADLDRDGNLDLYVLNFGGNDFLYRNGGPPSYGFTRVDTTAATQGAEFSIPEAIADFNGDGFDDVFLGNAGVQNDYLYTNHGGLYFTRTVLADGASTLGASWGDYDNDGNLDLVTPHYQGQKITLYHNAGAPGFGMVPVVTGPVGVDAGNWIGSAFGDYDNDGALDLYVSNDGAPGGLFHNDGPPAYGFTRVTTGPPATDVVSAFGAVWGDYDRDGQLDLFVADHAGGGNRLYHNGGTTNHWLTVQLTGTSSNRAGIGARIRLLATIAGAPRWQLREVTGQTGYNSQNLDQHFGLGDAATVDSLVIDWPSGRRDAWAGLAPDVVIRLIEGSGTAGVEPVAPAHGNRIELTAPRPNPSRGSSSLRFRLPRGAQARLDVFDLAGRRVTTPVDHWLAAGTYAARVDMPASAPDGVYLCRLSADGGSATVKLAVTR